MKLRIKTIKKEIEKDLWIPAIKDQIRIYQLYGQDPREWMEFLKKLEKEADRRLKELGF